MNAGSAPAEVIAAMNASPPSGPVIAPLNGTWSYFSPA